MPHTRSKGTNNLHPFTDDIDVLQRRLRAERRLQLTELDTMDDLRDEVNNDPPRRPRPIGAGDAPHNYHARHGIVPPAVENNNFEIKSGLISMVQNQKFHGLPVENPLDHLDEFERLCGLIKINGVSEDAFKLRLFPFSLGDKAHTWEKNLPPGSITTWQDCRTAFLAKFFSNSRTAKFRNNISSFTQRGNETLSEAWERFKGFQTQCPHHGFSDESLLSTLYRGVLPKFRMMLDTASNGNFLNKDVEEGWDLVENLATADGHYGEDYDRTTRNPTESDFVTKKEIKALSDKLDMLLLAKPQPQVHMVFEEETVPVKEEVQNEDICFMQNQGGYQRNQGNYVPNQNNFQSNQGNYNGYRSNPNPSYRNSNNAPQQDNTYQTPPNQQQFAPRPQYNNYRATQPAPPNFTRPPATTQVQQPHANADIVTMMQTMQQHILQGHSELQQRFDASQSDLSSRLDKLTSRITTLESQQASSSVRTSGQLPGKAIQNPKEFTINAFTLHTDTIEFSSLDSGLSVDRKIQVGEDTIINSPLPAFTPEDHKTEVSNIVSNSTTRPTTHQLAPTSEIPVESQQALLKLNDPGKFLLSCFLENTILNNCLCDSGASISLMPLSLAQQLNLTDFKSCTTPLVFTDKSTRPVYGILEDVPLTIGNTKVPTDFVVLDFGDNNDNQLLLGRPFLATVGALLDLKNGTIKLDLGKPGFTIFDLHGIEKRNRTNDLRPAAPNEKASPPLSTSNQE